MFNKFPVIHRIQQGLVIFIHKHNAFFPCLNCHFINYPFEPYSKRLLWGWDHIVLFLPTGKMILQNSFQYLFAIIIALVKVKIQHWVRLPGIRIIFLKRFNPKPFKKFLLSFPICSQRRKKQAFPEPTRAAEEIRHICVNKIIDIFCFININVMVHNDFFKALYSNRQLSNFHSHITVTFPCFSFLQFIPL